ncbi:ABC transporter permease [Beijerinckia sp. L45]|uniref:ABC transporter permease n=1 Tax=Beijerinckia sp. L45 TaxID=1641855 RepID=UPI00131BCBC8|nr:ABC transporter permease [Beijerinckia sp. L45]
MRPPARPGFLLVATRELRWMRRDRLALFLAIGVPLIAFALLAWTFSGAVIRDLNVTVADADRTPTSLRYVQAITSAPGVTVAARSNDLTDAMHAIRSGRAIAAVYIPEHFERDLAAQKHPQIVVFYNRQYFTPGNSASSAVTGAINAATAALPATAAPTTSAFKPGSLVVEQYVLTNPAMNYAQFLLRAILPTILHVLAAAAAGYAVGSEFSSPRSVGAWMKAAGGSPLAALVGKLAPLFGIFVIMMVVEAAVISHVEHIPFRGDSVLLGAAACMLIIAYLALGALFQLLTRNLATGLSVTALYCSPAFGFAGVGFPILAMSTFAQLWGAAMPLRWYIEILFDQASRGLPAADSAKPFGALGALAILFFALAWWRLRAVARRGPVKAPEPVRAFRDIRGLGKTTVAEAWRILGDKGALGMILLAPVIYGVLYPQPYLGQLLRGIPVAVVDLDRTELSRDLIETLNADEAVSVAVRAESLAEAQKALGRREVFAILGIPEGTEREVLKGNKARIPAYVDSAYFLLYSRMLQGISEASATVSARIATRGARLNGSLVQAALTRSSPIKVVSEPLFNPTGGYASYVVPAAFLLIVQQSLFMGVATLGGVAFASEGRSGRRRRGGLRAVVGQALTHLLFAAPGLALYLVVLPHAYGFSTLGKPLDLLAMAIPFVLSVSFLAQFAGAWFKRRESAVLMFMAVALPLFFMVGVSWPLEALPDALRTASRLFPSTSAIDGLVRINQMGASLHDVSRDWLTLWVLTGAYALLGALATRLANREATVGR